MSTFGEVAVDDAPGAPIEAYLPEALLWRELRGRPAGLRFCRQRATGKYVHDFYCCDARLAIEFENSATNAEREAWLERAGISTMRVSARHVLQGSHQAAREIVSRAVGLLPRDHPVRSRLAMATAAGNPN